MDGSVSTPRRVWVVGATSILGWNLANVRSSDLAVTPTCSHHCRDPRAHDWLRINVEVADDWEVLRRHAPDILIYSAGICNVDRCAAHPEHAWSVNLGGVTAMLDALPARTRLVHCSSDHVFGGRAQPYVESTPTEPISEYGRTRVAAERRVLERRPDALIVRVGLPIGTSMSGRIGHLDWLRYRHERGLPMTVVDGEHRAAVWATAGAERIFAWARSDVRGIRHLAAHRASHRPQLAAALCQHLGIEPAFGTVRRSTLGRPHLGHIDLQTEHDDGLGAPLRAAGEPATA